MNFSDWFKAPSDSSESEDEEEREKRRQEELRRRQERIKQNSKTSRKTENVQNEASSLKVNRLTFKDRLELQKILLHKEEDRNEFMSNVEVFANHFLGKNEENIEIMKNFRDYEEIRRFINERHFYLYKHTKDEDQKRNIHELLVKYSNRCLGALVAFSGLKLDTKHPIFNEDDNVFSNAHVVSIRRQLNEKKDDLKDLAGKFLEQRKKEEDLREKAKEDVIDMINMSFNLDEDISNLTDELTNVSISLSCEEDGNRDTSPTRISSYLSKKTFDALMKAIDHLKITTKEDKDKTRSRPVKRRNPFQLQVNNSSSSSSDDDDIDPADDSHMFKIFMKEAERDKPKEVSNVVERNTEDVLKNIKKEEPMDYTDGCRVKKKVRFVDYEDKRNMMLLFVRPFDRYTHDDDDGTTLAKLKIPLAEGYRLLKKIYPKMTSFSVVRDPKFQSYRLPRRMSWICRDFNELIGMGKTLAKERYKLYDNFCFKGEYGYFFYADNSNGENFEYLSLLGVCKEYSDIEFYNCFNIYLDIHVRSFRKELCREVMSGRAANSSSCIQLVPNYLISKCMDTLMDEENRFEEEANILESLRERSHHYGRISENLILSDWRFATLKTFAVLNAEIKLLPIMTGNSCINGVKSLLQELLSNDLDIKNIIFAFGGCNLVNITPIYELLILVYKLTADKDINVHWFSWDWIGKKLDQVDYELNGNEEDDSIVWFNRAIERFISKMNARHITNIKFQNVFEEIRICHNISCPRERMNSIYMVYLRNLMKNTSIRLSSKFCEWRDRRFEYYAGTDEDRFNDSINQ